MKIPEKFTLEAMKEFARDVYSQIKILTVGDFDLKGRRVTNAGKAIDDFDYVRKAEIDRIIAGLSGQTSTVTINSGSPSGLLQTVSAIRASTFPNRGSAVAHDRELFLATDQNYMAWVSLSGVWKYAFGIYALLQADLAAFTTGIGTNDDRLLVEISNYDHILQWSGSAWTWGPGEVGSGYYQMFESAPTSAGANAWQVCDGTTVARLNADGTTTNVATPDLGSAAYLVGGTSAASIAAATGATTSEGLHTHDVAVGTTTTGVNDTDHQVPTGSSGGTVAETGHTHSVDYGTITSAAGTSHTHGSGTLELRRKQAALYYRR